MTLYNVQEVHRRRRIRNVRLEWPKKPFPERHFNYRKEVKRRPGPLLGAK